MDIEKAVRSLAMPLPEDILKRKWAGDFAGAMAAIDLRLQEQLPEMLAWRLRVERERLRRMPTQYPWNRAQAFEKLRALVPDITEAEFDSLELQGKVDFLYINGEKRYFVRFHRTLVKTIPELMARSGGRTDGKSPWLDPMIAAVKEKGSLAYRISLEGAMHLDEGAFVPDTYRIHIPVPAPSAQQRDIVIDAPGAQIGPEDALARTAYWEKPMTVWEDVPLRYTYVSQIRYADPLHAPAPAAPLYPAAGPVEENDLAEEAPYMRFTPYLRSLAAELAAGESTPVGKAKKFYDFVTQQVKYSFMRDYFQIDDLGEYCAVNLKGDCGLQALLFILLCRIAGIPARWQSGLSIDADYVGSHDWAQFYLEGWGWLFADPSYGGSAWRAGNLERHAFYFGNLDPMRMVANRRYQAELLPRMEKLRIDPYDNQSGEIERVSPDAPAFTGRDVDTDMSLVSRELL